MESKQTFNSNESKSFTSQNTKPYLHELIKNEFTLCGKRANPCKLINTKINEITNQNSNVSINRNDQENLFTFSARVSKCFTEMEETSLTKRFKPTVLNDPYPLGGKNLILDGATDTTSGTVLIKTNIQQALSQNSKTIFNRFGASSNLQTQGFESCETTESPNLNESSSNKSLSPESEINEAKNIFRPHLSSLDSSEPLQNQFFPQL